MKSFLVHLATYAAVLSALAVLAALVGNVALARELDIGSSPSSILAPAGTPPGAVADPGPRAWHPSCAAPRRRPVSLVLGLDDFRDYRPAHLFEAPQVKALLSALCPGDRVTPVLVEKKAVPLGLPVVVKDLTDLDDLALRIEERREPRSFRRTNDALLQAAVAAWGSDVDRATPDLLRVLVFLTRDLASEASKGREVPDFSWTSPPYWLEGHALTAILRPIASDKAVEAWEVFVASRPAGPSSGEVTQGLRVDLAAFLDPARLVPEPPKPVRINKAKMQIEVPAELPPSIRPPDLPVLWPEPEGILRWDRAWTPWLLAGGAVFLLLVTLAWLLLRAPAKHAAGPDRAAPELTLLLHDRLHGKVVTREKRRLDGPIRMGASASNDLPVPGPYSLELLPGPAGAGPRLRSTNSLPLEVQRAAGGRMLRATDSVPIPLRSGDRIHLGAGQEVEVLFA